METNNDPLHDMLLARATADSHKRVASKMKRFGRYTDIDEDMRERAIVDEQNRSALVQLMLQYSLTIPAREFRQWRPTLRVKGQITGLYDFVEIIATNGLLGWFLDGTSTPLCAHIQTFDGEVKPLFSVTPKNDGKVKVKSLRKKSRRQSIIDAM